MSQLLRFIEPPGGRLIQRSVLVCRPSPGPQPAQTVSGECALTIRRGREDWTFVPAAMSERKDDQ